MIKTYEDGSQLEFRDAKEQLVTDKKRRIDIFVDSLRECGLEFPCTIANSTWLGAYERGDISLADLHSCATFRPIDHDNKEFRLAAVQP